MNAFNSVKVGYVFQKAMAGLEGKIEKEEESRKPSVTQVRANVFIPRHLHLTSPNLVLPKQPKHADCRLTSTPRKTPGTKTPDLETQKNTGMGGVFFFFFAIRVPGRCIRSGARPNRQLSAVQGTQPTTQRAALRREACFGKCTSTMTPETWLVLNRLQQGAPGAGTGDWLFWRQCPVRRGGGDVMHTVWWRAWKSKCTVYGLFDGRGHDVSTRQTATLRAVSLRSERRPKGPACLGCFPCFALAEEIARRFSRGTGPATCRVLKTKEEVYGNPITAWVTPCHTHARNPWGLSFFFCHLMYIIIGRSSKTQG